MGLPSSIFSLAVLLLSIVLVSGNDPIIYNLDCGAVEGNIANINKGGTSDGLSKLTWVGDGDFVKTGVTYNLSVPAGEDGTLRAFPKYRKNCYTFKVEVDRKIQVWFNFSYSNYDGRRKPPVFKLIFDGGDWGELDTGFRTSITVIYLATRNTTDVCFGRMYDDQDPFVSSMQVAVYGPQMYPKVNSSTAIYDPMYYAYGPSNETLKYPDDHYDRYWLPSNITNYISNFTVLNREASTTTVDTSLCVDDPPTKLFNGAVAPGENAKAMDVVPLNFVTPGAGSPMYVNMYFIEISSALTEKRRIQIFMDSVLISNASHPIMPSYEKGLEFSYIVPNLTSYTTLTLSSTASSTLPPIISGFEYSYLKEFSTSATYLNDVNAIVAFQNSFKVLEPWSGDPCLPLNYTWEWIGCNLTMKPPRITNLYLGSYGLGGTLPDFSALDALETIDLQNNSLSGDIPEFLAKLPNLRELNLAYNNFTSLPKVLQGGKITVNTTGNPMGSSNDNNNHTASTNSEGGSRQIPLLSLFYCLWVLFVVVP